jgi:hypothetical protein
LARTQANGFQQAQQLALLQARMAQVLQQSSRIKSERGPGGVLPQVAGWSGGVWCRHEAYFRQYGSKYESNFDQCGSGCECVAERLDAKAHSLFAASLTPQTVIALHALLSDGLMADPMACGRIRRRAVEIGGSVYLPVVIPQRVEELFGIVITMAAEVTDPFEQAFFCWCTCPTCSRLRA